MEEKYLLVRPSSKKRRKRVGCGPGSGHGKTSCRGTKGQMSRSGHNRKAGFEGGQMPLQRRIPKRGFNNFFKTDYQIINVSSIEKLNVSEVDATILKAKGLIHYPLKLIKILGNGELTKPIKIKADAFSQSAIDKIKKAGGEAIVRDLPRKAKEEGKNQVK